MKTGCVMAAMSTHDGGKEYSVATYAMEGAPYPTVQDAMTNLGDPRGLVALLWRAMGDGAAGVVTQPNNEWYPVRQEDVDVIFPGVVYWRVAEMTEQYRGEESVFIAGHHLFSTTNEYFDKVVRKRPDGVLPNPAETLYDYMRFEIRKTHLPPPGYRTLDERRKREKWPVSMDGWPSRIDVALIGFYPPAAIAAPPVRTAQANPTGGGSSSGPSWAVVPTTDGGVNSYYMVVGMRPREGTLLYNWVGGNGWIL
ncbi:MAG: hypothetical protein GY772_15755, partial [bacterium]|nr:hypothetical protein [bacterium]